MKLEEVRIEKGKVDGLNYVAIRLPRRMRTLASTILNGGLGETDSVLMLQVPLQYDHEDPVKHLRSLLPRLELPPDTVSFMTAAELEKAFCSQGIEQNGSEALAFVSAGISNAIRAGESSREGSVPHRQVGTINVMVVTDEPLDDCALTNAVMTVTEAKAAALQDHHIPGTGTTSDAVLIMCPSEGERCMWSGSSSDHGIAMAVAVRSALGESITRWKGANGDSVHFLRHLAIRGITYDDMWECVRQMNALDPAWDESAIRKRFENKLEQLAKDVNVNALLTAAMVLEEKGRYGQLYGLPEARYQEDPVHLLADELLGIALAEYIGGTKCLFEYIRYDKKKPGILSKLGPFMDDIVASLIGSTMSVIYSEILEGEGRLS
ncbi:MAG: Adenosylcobinamide amidohydrolase [Methanomassiliicoccales archaeon PtaB.Bin134]|nr:MAG: Adenosylcobinamide amidohydrolase [Methanomassiliicoccales archaeon PtaB.Bin134]